RVTIALALLVGCGKSTQDQASTEPKLSETSPAPGAPPANRAASADAKPVKPPAKAAPRGPEHAVYSLVDNRLSAHLTRGGGLLVAAGSAGFAKYLRFANIMKGAKKQWELRQTEGEIRVARLAGKSGSVYVPLTAAQAGRAKVRLRAFAGGESTVSLRVNDGKDING